MNVQNVQKRTKMINIAYCVIVVAFCCLSGYLAYIGNYWLSFFALLAIPSLSLSDKQKTVYQCLYSRRFQKGSRTA